MHRAYEDYCTTPARGRTGHAGGRARCTRRCSHHGQRVKCIKVTRTTARHRLCWRSVALHDRKTAQQNSCSPDRLAEGIRSSVCVEGSRPARSCGMAAGGVRENPELFSIEAPIGVQRGAGTKVLAKPQVAARSAVRSVPVTVIILPVALPGSPERRCARSAD